ncbi:gliding motility-associated C-terminal domain-containing protein [Flavobacterium sp.]|uniref:T9SS type B sorting domain-containing protein n=1 Tax=Flavobacterium sp. TaxID=239 RepID=UPI003A94989A
MKKLLLFTSFLLFLSQTAFSQFQNGLWIGKEANTWCLPYIGITFTSGEPVVTMDGIQLFEATEGLTAISDVDGELLFYAGGKTVWNKNNVVMLNGSGLLSGAISSTQSGVVVKKPGSDNIYYLFNIDEGASFSPGLLYSEIDMTLDNGLGAITENKNIVLDEDAKVEKITAVHHADGEQVWVITHRAISDTYVAYLVSANGVSTTPVISNIGTFYEGFPYPDAVFYGPEGIGYLKASPDGSKLAAALFNGPNKGVDVFDFNNETGEITNHMHVGDFTLMLYGVEFSPNSKYLYVCNSLGFVLANEVYQFDVTSTTNDDLIASKEVISTVSLDSVIGNGAMQLGPDGKIYINNLFQNSLNVINCPNNQGSACMFQYNQVPLSFAGGVGLPSFVQSYFESGIIANQICPDDAVTFTLLRIPEVDSVTWDFGDPDSGNDNASTDIDGVHLFSAPGTYTVTAVVTSNGAIQTAAVEIVIEAPEDGFTAPADITVCSDTAAAEFDLTQQGEQVLNGLNPDEYTITYYTSQEDAQLQENEITTPNAYTTIEQTIYMGVLNNENSCYAILSFELIVSSFPQVNELPEITLCDDSIEDGYTIFDLTENENLLTEGQENITVAYFISQEDAEEESNEIVNPTEYENISNPQTIYVRVGNASCSDVTTYNILVFEYPLMEREFDVTGCSPFNLPEIILPEGITIQGYYETETDAELSQNAFTTPNTYVVEGDKQTIYVRGEAANGCAIIFYLNISNDNCFIPRGISPNGDNKNDEFDLSGFDVDSLSIFNRYGQEVYSMNNYTNEWYGQNKNGSELPTGTYYYAIKMNDGDTKTGWVYINRQEN